jgi:hypothetical protein
MMKKKKVIESMNVNDMSSNKVQPFFFCLSL